jgi:hypothetical protein
MFNLQLSRSQSIDWRHSRFNWKFRETCSSVRTIVDTYFSVLDFNQLSGPVPESIVKLTKLKWL